MLILTQKFAISAKYLSAFVALSFVFVAKSQTTIFNFTGGTQTYTVPTCVTSIQYVVRGAQGGGGNGGRGATVSGTLAVTPGQVLQIRVGGQGSGINGGYNGGANGVSGGYASAGGGGASDIRVAPYNTANRIIVAAGGGGQGGGTPSNPTGGSGGCATGSVGTNSYGTAGTGGTQFTGGIGGVAYSASGTNGSNGTLANGGQGGTDNCGSTSHGGGGGGGYYGGGGGGPDCFGGGAPYGGGGGGGGSSLTPAGASCTGGNRSGNGSVTITLPSAPISTISTANTSICQGTNFTIGGNITATGAWTLTLNNGQTTTGTGNGTWSIVVSPTSTTTYSVASIVDAVRCTTNPPGSVTLTLPTAGPNLSLNNQSATCLVNQNGYIHFYHTSGRLLASINSFGQNLGNVTITSYVDGANQVVPACQDPTNPTHFTAVMQRHWVITPSIQPSSPVSVKLPFLNSELTTLSSVAGSNANTNDDLTGIGDLKMSKYSGPANVDNNALNNCTTAGGNSGTTLHAQTLSGATTTYSAVTGASFSSHSITSFSEFWLHGSTSNSPLPIVLGSFDISCSNGSANLHWTTNSEQNTSHFLIQKSTDGKEWTEVSTMNAAGNSTQPISYTYTDHASRPETLIYYRFILIDFNGDKTTFPTKSINCGLISEHLSVYPNPNSGLFYASYSNSDYTSEILITDINGRIIKSFDTIDTEKTTLELDVSDVSPGVYFVQLIQGKQIKEAVRIIKE